MNQEPRIVVKEDIITEAAGRFVRTCSNYVRDRDIFQVALSGGDTPKRLYTALAQPPFIDAVDWEGVEVFFGDERNVPPNHEDSNYRMACRKLLDHVPLVVSQIHPMPGADNDLERAARAYENTVKRCLIPDYDNVKAFDLVLLGLTEDGSTASLFPNSPALQEKERLVVATENPETKDKRLSLTFGAINSARNVWFLVTGKDKAGIVNAVLSGKGDSYPAGMVDPEYGEHLWLLDPDAASEVDPELLSHLTE